MNQDPVVTLSLPLSQVDVLAKALGELPLKISGSVMTELNKQVTAQLQPPAPAQKAEG